MNPEFRRQLWLQFSATRMGVLPLLMLFIFTAVYLSAHEQALQAIAVAGAVLFMALVWGMGTMAAGTSVMDEIADHTWDQQRMSAMQPWAMTWGKLAGAPAYGWYGGGLCLLIAVPCALLVDLRSVLLQAVLGGILTGVLLHALLIAVNLQLAKVGGKAVRRGGAWVLIVVLLFGVGPVVETLRVEDTIWWNLAWDKTNFSLASLALFACCAILAAWRSMAEVLAVRQLPWGWPALALVATAYLSGFAPRYPVAAFGVVGLGTCAVLTYFAFLTEPQQRPVWQRVVHRFSAGQWRAALLQLPRWPTTLLLALPCAVLTSLASPSGSFWPWAVLEPLVPDPAFLQPVSFVLLMARDCALALFFAFSPTSRRPMLAFATLMLVLYGLVPWIGVAADLGALLKWTQPLLASGVHSVVAAALHLAVALALLRWRWIATNPH